MLFIVTSLNDILMLALPRGGGLQLQHGVQLVDLPRPDHHRRQPRRDRLRRLQERGHTECLRLLLTELCEYIHG